MRAQELSIITLAWDLRSSTLLKYNLAVLHAVKSTDFEVKALTLTRSLTLTK